MTRCGSKGGGGLGGQMTPMEDPPPPFSWDIILPCHDFRQYSVKELISCTQSQLASYSYRLHVSYILIIILNPCSQKLIYNLIGAPRCLRTIANGIGILPNLSWTHKFILKELQTLWVGVIWFTRMDPP